jgi:signal transduction histidine kinase
MSDPLRKVSAPHDPKGRLISIFVGAVLLPSLALSYVSLEFVPQLAKGRKASLFKSAERDLFHIEKELAQSAQAKALGAARAVGTERLLDGRPHIIQEALAEAGLDPHMFESLHLEGASPRVRFMAGKKFGETPREAWSALEPAPEQAPAEESVPWAGQEGSTAGVLRYRYSSPHVQTRLIREYFEKEFSGAEQGLVIRVSVEGRVVYETRPTPNGKFEVYRLMESPSFRGLKLSMRFRDLSIEQDVRRWEIGTLALIGFIDLMLGAGLFLVYSNVRREMHLSRLKSDFVANVSHELKTPLALIRLFAETLELGRVANDDKARQYYRVINKESQRLTQLINNILDFSRIEAGRKEYRFAPTDVARMVSETVESYRFQIEQQGFKLELALQEGLPLVEADQEALSQALLNLMNNAIKYSSDDKWVRLEVGQVDGRLAIAVSDHGIGIPKSEQKKIFEKFYRGEDSLVHETKGSGLGLPLVQHIMEAHGGEVDVESAPGKGSTFILSLPVTQPKREA